MPKTTTRYNLMYEQAPRCQTSSGEHVWHEVSRPEGHRSGVHVDRCPICGIEVEYDTSD